MAIPAQSFEGCPQPRCEDVRDLHRESIDPARDGSSLP